MIKPAMRMPPADSEKAVTEEYIKAVNLNRRILTAAQLAQQSLYEMCAGFKEMRDSKLYKELGYSTFEDYCEKEVEITRQHVYKYIAIAEKLPADFVAPGRQIGLKKLHLLTTLSEEERHELTEKTDLENTSVRKLEQQIKQLREERDSYKAKAAERPQNYVDITAYERVVNESNEERERLEGELLAEKRKAYSREEELKAKIAELESRPVEVAVQEDKESAAELERVRKELEELRNAPPETVTVTDANGVFKAYFKAAYDPLNRLVEYVREQGSEDWKSRIMKLLDSVKTTLEGNT